MSTFSPRSALRVVPLIVTIAQAASAQDASDSKPENRGARRVTIVQAATLPEPGGRAIVVLQRDASPRDVIVLPAQGATPADLASALNLLARAGQDPAPLPAPQLRISISSADFVARQSPAVEQYLRGILERLSRAPLVDLPGVATGRGLTVPQHRANPG